MATSNDQDKYIDLRIVDGDIVPDNKHALETRFNNAATNSTKLVNLTSVKLDVCYRDGTVTTLMPETSVPCQDKLVIGHQRANYQAPLEVIDGDECILTNMIRRQLAAKGGQFLYWEEAINIEAIQNSRNGVYIKSADAVVSLYDRRDSMSHHPFSSQRIHNLYLNVGDDFNAETDISVSIRFIDNELLRTRLYAIFHDRILVLQPKRSNTLKSGIYISGLNRLDTEYANTIRRDTHYLIEDVLAGECPIRMYKTLLEAKDALAELKQAHIKEQHLMREHEKLLAKMKREQQVIEQENNLLKQQQAKDKIELDEQETLRAIELQRQKLEYEERMNRAKEEATNRANLIKTTEAIVKLIAAGITIGFSIYKLTKQ